LAGSIFDVILISGLALEQAVECPLLKQAGNPVRLLVWCGRHARRASRLPPRALAGTIGPLRHAVNGRPATRPKRSADSRFQVGVAGRELADEVLVVLLAQRVPQRGQDGPGACPRLLLG